MHVCCSTSWEEMHVPMSRFLAYIFRKISNDHVVELDIILVVMLQTYRLRTRMKVSLVLFEF